MPKTIHRPEYDVLRLMIRRVREDAGITQLDMSIQLDRTQSFISDIERGARRIDALELRDICQLAGKDFQTFVGELEQAIAKLPAKRKRSMAPSQSKGPNRTAKPQ